MKLATSLRLAAACLAALAGCVVVQARPAHDRPVPVVVY